MHFLQSQMFVSRVYTQNIRRGWKNQALRLFFLRKLGDPLSSLFFLISARFSMGIKTSKT